MKYILIIKHGALGDIILATGPMQAIRNHHPDAHLTLLTTKPYDTLLAECPFIDEIWVDTRPKIWHIGRFIRLINQLRAQEWEWVYDLQTSQRSTSYFRFLNTKYYSGLHLKGSHPHNTPERTSLHTIDRQKQQLEIAGIHDVPAPNIDWLEQDISHLLRHGNEQRDEAISSEEIAASPSAPRNDEKYVLIVPGGSAHRPEKRWPAEHYSELCIKLLADGFTPLLIGTRAEEEILQRIASSDQRIINLCNQTSFAQIASLARKAHYAVGNDTGPMHIIAAAGCPCTVLFNTTASNPALCAPRTAATTILKSEDLQQLSVDFVRQTVIKAE